MNDEERERLLKQLDEAKKKLKEYEEKAAKAEKASKMKSLFLANMSHEIRTPLNAIEGFSRIIAETDSAKERSNFLEIIESNNNRLLALVNEILDLSKVESGEIALDIQPVNLDMVCKEIKDVFKFRCNENVALICDSKEKGITMMTDKNRLTQVFSNLISNAIKHTPSGSIKFGYELIKDNNIRFHVTDTGSGISKEDIKTIFYKYVSMDENMKGFGLGLPLSKIIIERLGGSISVKSELGKGSSFIFDFSFEDGSDGHKYRAKNADGKNKKEILFAGYPTDGQNEIISKLSNNFTVQFASNGIEAVNINEADHPDLIIMNTVMNEMDGYDTLSILKEISPKTPVIAMDVNAKEIQKVINAGFNDYIKSPFDINILMNYINKYITFNN